MRNLLFLILAGFLGACSLENSEKKVDRSDSTEIILDYSDTTIRSLTIPQAMILKENYTKNYLPIIKEQLGVDDTQYIHYNLEDLKNLVWYIEYYSKASGKEILPGDLGVNIHFGQYPKTNLTSFPLREGEEKILAGKQTIFFVPTIKIDGEIKEFNPKKNFIEISKGESKHFKTLFEHYQNQLGTFKQVDYDEDSPIADFGNHCPPCTPPIN